MKRKKQTVIFMILILGFSLFLIHFFDLYLDREQLFYAYERGNLCGPSEEIVYEEERQDDSVMMIGRQEKALYMLSAEKVLGIFWKYQNGSDNGYFEMSEEIDGYILNDGRYVGLCRIPSVTKVEVYFGIWRDRKTEIVTVDVGKGGLLYTNTELDGMSFLPWCVRGKDKEGKIVYERWHHDDLIEQWAEIQQQK